MLISLFNILFHYFYFQETVLQSDIKLKSRGHYSQYSSSHKAGVFNEVALTALPAFLSMVPTTLVRRNIN